MAMLIMHPIRMIKRTFARLKTAHFVESLEISIKGVLSITQQLPLLLLAAMTECSQHRGREANIGLSKAVTEAFFRAAKVPQATDRRIQCGEIGQ